MCIKRAFGAGFSPRVVKHKALEKLKLLLFIEFLRCILNLIRFLCHLPQLCKLAYELHQHQIHKTGSLCWPPSTDRVQKVKCWLSYCFWFSRSRNLFTVLGRQVNWVCLGCHLLKNKLVERGKPGILCGRNTMPWEVYVFLWLQSDLRLLRARGPT